MMIGELSKKSETGVETIRYYEREGLIAPASRKPSGYRNYDPTDALSRLHFIKRAKELGFSLKEIRELLLLNSNRKSKCEQVRVRAQSKVNSIEEKINDLTQMKKALSSLIECCRSELPSSDCPILDSLSEDIA